MYRRGNAARGPCGGACPPQALRRGFADTGALAALPDFHVAMALLATGASAPLELAPLPCVWVVRLDWRAAAAVGNAEAPTRRAQLWWRAACACAMLSGLALSLGWLWLVVRLWPVMIVQ